MPASPVRRRLPVALSGMLVLGLLAGGAPVVRAQGQVGADPAKLKAARARAIEFLRTTQAADGTWTTPQAVGLTGLVTAAALRGGARPDDPMIQKALAFLSALVQPDGGIYNPMSAHKNYETSICLLAFHAANGSGKYTKVIAGARDYLKKLQWDEDEDVKPDDPRYGGAGYGGSQRPDLSNTAFLLDALKAAGIEKDDPALKNALVFISRCQNLESQHNTTPFASKINDGGFYYTPAAGGASFAGKTDNDGLKSYGSMTYAGLKSMIYAGLTPNDPRVSAAYKWLQKHYSVTENPGMQQAGLYYYYHTFAKALDAMGSPTITDSNGMTHDWRRELGDRLLALQKENGSWLNDERRWQEGDPNLTTGYVLLTLEYCDAPTKK